MKSWPALNAYCLLKTSRAGVYLKSLIVQCYEIQTELAAVEDKSHTYAQERHLIGQFSANPKFCCLRSI